MNKIMTIIVLLTLTASCSSKFAGIVRKQASGFISNQELEYMIEHKESVAIIDLRSPSKYSDGHVPGAINIPYYKIDSITNKILRMINVVIYDQSLVQSKPALKRLRYLGYENTRMLFGGFEDWTYPVEKD